MSDENDDNVLPFAPPAPRSAAAGNDDAGNADTDPSLYFCFSATLRIFGKDLDLDAISAVLGLEPTAVIRQGDVRRPASRGLHDRNGWLLSSPLGELQPLDEHIEWLYEKLHPHFDYLKGLKEHAMVDIFCGYRSNSDTAGFVVAHRSLRLFVELEVPFGVSVIVIGDD